MALGGGDRSLSPPALGSDPGLVMPSPVPCGFMGPDPQQKIRRHVLGATKKTDRCFHWATVVSLLQFCGVLEGTNPARGGFVGCVHKGAPPPMAIASYYRDQARLLLSWARE